MLYFKFKNPLLISSLLLSLLFKSCTTYGQESFEMLFQEIEERGEFNGNVLLIKNDTVLYEGSYGYAEPAKNSNLDSGYYFQIGSIQKEFPAVAIMQLKEKGLLNVNDKISNFLPELPPWSSKISIKNLLQYSSGLPQVDWDSYFAKGMMIENEVVDDISDIKELEFEPGTDYIYSNYNPMLLKKIVESITSKNFKEYVEEDILQAHDIEGILIQERFPYLNKERMAFPFNKRFEPDNLEFEMLTVVATVNGMYNWFRKLDYFKIISKESLQFLSQEVIAGNNIQAPIGRGDWKNNKLELHLHHGSSGNYEVLVRHHKQEKLFIILLTNQKHGNLHEIADICRDIIKEMESRLSGAKYIRPFRYRDIIQLAENGKLQELETEIKNDFEKKMAKKLLEDEVNKAGYYFLQENKYNKAIDVFKINVLAFPGSANVYDSLAEAYMYNENTVMALRYYQRSLELNPQNANAVQMIKKLQVK